MFWWENEAFLVFNKDIKAMTWFCLSLCKEPLPTNTETKSAWESEKVNAIQSSVPRDNVNATRGNVVRWELLAQELCYLGPMVFGNLVI